MNTIEDRLREALRERARYSPVDPDAWERTIARTRRTRRTRPTRTRARAGAWSRFLIPVAAAAAVVAIIAGAAAMTGHLGSRGRASQAAEPSIPPPLNRNDYLIEQDPPVSEIVKTTISAGGQVKSVYLWFARMKGGHGTVLCSEIWLKQTVDAAVCQSVQLSAQRVAVFTAADNTILLGASSIQVASVRAQLPGGQEVAGRVFSGRGFPAKVWLVSAPVEGHTEVVFGNAAGRQIGQLSFAGGSAFPPAGPGGITVFRNQNGSATAYLAGGRVEVSSTGVPQAAFATQQASGPPEVGVFTSQDASPPTWLEFYGYAHENVARVTVRLADGRQVGTKTFPGWKGSGIRLWAVAAPAHLPLRLRYVVLAYDAAGHVVWQLTFG
jgi:hypothetical protein